ncbi:MAG: GNAT family N-acetyltransferase [Clostridia bacterium]|nr:GNAT family N-acetyltransferase [Clostridia bacterium]
MMVRLAVEKDILNILDLLRQVNEVHFKGRPDIFKLGVKYSYEEIKEKLNLKNEPILVWADGEDNAKGYCFCVVKKTEQSSVLKPIKTLYIDDLCVDEDHRGEHIGKALYESALNLAKELGCYNLTLNVWSCNPSAMRFYEKLGLVPQKIYMEKVLV